MRQDHLNPTAFGTRTGKAELARSPGSDGFGRGPAVKIEGGGGEVAVFGGKRGGVGCSLAYVL